MKTVLIIISVVVLIFIIKSFKTVGQKTKADGDADTTNSSTKQLQNQEKPNDKLVIVNEISKTEITSVLNGFCKMYNDKKSKIRPRLYQLSESQFAITFPFDIDFELFCYFVNYVRYPMDFDKSFEVSAWETTKQSKGWITEKSAHKKVMLFIPEDDGEHDNVFLTTEDNIGYKLGFAVGEEKQLLKAPKKTFSVPPIDIETLSNKKGQDF